MATTKKKAVQQSKVSKTAPKAPVKKAATAKPVAKKAVAKKAAAVKKAAPKVAAPPKAAIKKASAAKKAAPVKKAGAAPMAKKTVKAAAPEKAVVPAKKAATAPAPKKTAATAKPASKQPAVPAKAAAAPVKKNDKPAVAKKTTKDAPEIAKKVKKESQPLKEVKVPKISTTSKKSYKPSYTPLEQREADGNQQPLVTYSEEDLQEFKTLISKKLADAKREVAYLQGIITRKDDMGGDVESRYMTMEDGTVSMEREQLSQMASRQIAYIDNLEKALIRIENKTYGICRVTGKLIDKARLRAVPHATLSIEAKLNRRNGSSNAQ